MFENENLNAIGETAFAHGNEIHVARGKMDADVLMHEAVHVVQQGLGIAGGGEANTALETQAQQVQQGGTMGDVSAFAMPAAAANAPVLGFGGHLKKRLKKLFGGSSGNNNQQAPPVQANQNQITNNSLTQGWELIKNDIEEDWELIGSPQNPAIPGLLKYRKSRSTVMTKFIKHVAVLTAVTALISLLGACAQPAVIDGEAEYEAQFSELISEREEVKEAEVDILLKEDGSLGANVYITAEPGCFVPGSLEDDVATMISHEIDGIEHENVFVAYAFIPSDPSDVPSREEKQLISLELFTAINIEKYLFAGKANAEKVSVDITFADEGSVSAAVSVTPSEVKTLDDDAKALIEETATHILLNNIEGLSKEKLTITTNVAE